MLAKWKCTLGFEGKCTLSFRIADGKPPSEADRALCAKQNQRCLVLSDFFVIECCLHLGQTCCYYACCLLVSFHRMDFH